MLLYSLWFISEAQLFSINVGAGRSRGQPFHQEQEGVLWTWDQYYENHPPPSISGGVVPCVFVGHRLELCLHDHGSLLLHTASISWQVIMWTGQIRYCIDVILFQIFKDITVENQCWDSTQPKFYQLTLLHTNTNTRARAHTILCCCDRGREREKERGREGGREGGRFKEGDVIQVHDLCFHLDQDSYKLRLEE